MARRRRRSFFKFPRGNKRGKPDLQPIIAFIGLLLLSVLLTYPLQSLLFIGLILSCLWYQRNKNREILRTSGIQEIDRMDGTEFEDRIKLLYEDMGYSVEKTPETGDFGGDLIANKPGERIVIQCKRYSHPVGLKAIQEAATAVLYYKANRAMVITNNKFTPQAVELAKVNKVELWDRTKLIEALYSVTRSEINGILAMVYQRYKKPETEE
ncbi:type II restriction endonuclease [Desulforamulus profundi]|uniref:Type II restriction endonuclease n=2 Tax=Desulforamulus profundi TaxID=1383067 RepID=A0A2C6MAB7_9FIRM|nr:type II restriction endonuclease [Desulforamulus profundi]